MRLGVAVSNMSSHRSVEPLHIFIPSIYKYCSVLLGTCPDSDLLSEHEVPKHHHDAPVIGAVKNSTWRNMKYLNISGLNHSHTTTRGGEKKVCYPRLQSNCGARESHTVRNFTRLSPWILTRIRFTISSQLILWAWKPAKTDGSRGSKFQSKRDALRLEMVQSSKDLDIDTQRNMTQGAGRLSRITRNGKMIVDVELRWSKIGSYNFKALSKLYPWDSYRKLLNTITINLPSTFNILYDHDPG